MHFCPKFNVCPSRLSPAQHVVAPPGKEEIDETALSWVYHRPGLALRPEITVNDRFHFKSLWIFLASAFGKSPLKTDPVACRISTTAGAQGALIDSFWGRG
jgi:hypothetical protein